MARNLARVTVDTMVNIKDTVLQDSGSPKDEALPPAVPAPPYRHAAPSGPWPWIDLRNITVPTATDATETSRSSVSSWRGYPQNLFGNWTPDQVARSEMLTKCSKNRSSTIYWMDVCSTGKFETSRTEGGHIGTVTASNSDPEKFLKVLNDKRFKEIRVRSLCIDNLTEPVLQMLGTKYNIEPCFFTSSVNWIPSRYQEASTHGKGDHITITLPFVWLHYKPQSSSPSTPASSTRAPSQLSSHSQIPTTVSQTLVDKSYQTRDSQINTQAPFPLHNGDILFIDLLSIHMVRSVEENTIISYHPDSTWCQTSAERLHSLMLLVGQGVYWQNIFTKCKDPTFLFLAMLWYALYAWDEAFESLYNHISWLESEVLTESRVEHTRDLHILKAHLLHYDTLLQDFKLSVSFICLTPNPAMESGAKDRDKSKETTNPHDPKEAINPDDPKETINPHDPKEAIHPDDPKETDDSKEIMELECKNLHNEIERLQNRRGMMSDRLKNVMDLAFANVNIRESASMRQITYLTMIFLPASLIASVFGMNVMEINPGSLETIDRYIETTIGLTLLTFYIVIAVQTHTVFHERGASLRDRAMWPILYPHRWTRKIINSSKEEFQWRRRKEPEPVSSVEEVKERKGPAHGENSVV